MCFHQHLQAKVKFENRGKVSLSLRFRFIYSIKLLDLVLCHVYLFENQIKGNGLCSQRMFNNTFCVNVALIDPYMYMDPSIKRSHYEFQKPRASSNLLSSCKALSKCGVLTLCWHLNRHTSLFYWVWVESTTQ